MDPRTGSLLDRADVATELTYLRARADPPWERPHHDGRDVTLEPELQSPYQRQRRLEYEERVELYRAEGLL
ncbi:hypothetical protein CH252_20970 [Rhodococcus sp. 06-1477-1B]|nr:hypothetical protein CH252_20970 [Rhodococcus sp. 06-1477-1B]